MATPSSVKTAGLAACAIPASNDKRALHQRQTKTRAGLKYMSSRGFLYQLLFGLMVRALSRLHQPSHDIVRLCYSAQSKISSTTTSSISSHIFNASRDTLSLRPSFTPNLRRFPFLGLTTFSGLLRFASGRASRIFPRWPQREGPQGR